MCPKEKQATPQVAFVFLGPLTKVPPASAGSGARQCGEPESISRGTNSCTNTVIKQPEVNTGKCPCISSTIP